MNLAGGPRRVDEAVVNVLLDVVDDPLKVIVSTGCERPLVMRCRPNDIEKRRP